MAAARRGRAAVRALRRRLRARADRLPAPRPARACCARSPRTPRSSPPPTAARRPASTATAGPAASCSPLCTRPRRSGCSRRVKRLFDPANLLNPGIIVDPAPLDADLRVPAGAAACARGLGFAYPHDGGDFTAAVHRCTGVGKCRADTTASGGVMCPSYLATRDEKDSTRGRARVLQELANGSLVSGGGRRPRSPRRSTCACPARAAPPTARRAWTWPPTRPRRSTSATGAGSGPRPTTHSAGCPAGPGSRHGHRGWPGWRTRRCASRRPRRSPSGSAASTTAVTCPGSRRRASASGSPPTAGGGHGGHGLPAPTAGRGGRRAAASRCCCGWTRSPTPSRRRSARPRSRCSRPPGYEVQITGRQRLLRPHLDLHRTAGRRAPPAAPHPARAAAGARRGHPDRRALSRPAPRRCAATPPTCCPATRAAAALAGAVRTLAELLATTDGWTPPDLSDVTGVAQPHCHQHAVLGWDADAALLREAGAAISAVGGCCGLAGNFGVERGHYDVSVAVAETALLPAVRKARASGRDRPGRRLLLPHPARPAGRHPRHPPGRAPGRPPPRRRPPFRNHAAHSRPLGRRSRPLPEPRGTRARQAARGPTVRSPIRSPRLAQNPVPE